MLSLLSALFRSFPPAALPQLSSNNGSLFFFFLLLILLLPRMPFTTFPTEACQVWFLLDHTGMIRSHCRARSGGKIGELRGKKEKNIWIDSDGTEGEKRAIM